METIIPVDCLKKSPLNVHPTEQDFHDMGKNACDTAERCFTSENREPEIKEADQVLVKPYHQTGEDNFAKTRTALSTGNSLEEDQRGPVGKIPRAWESKIDWKDHRQYLARCKSQEEDKDKWFPEENISDGKMRLRQFKAYRRTEEFHQL
ncbi:hypothetical protein O181_058027 [Austropuccinia psidii MF-1]|uniref:Uncharacterized protein n=1 Tax=Austropuccinia psidii MF-1 TaxID=1389203 RepID=A0A9Q3EIX5_9BASI|nr:hypothetical protein [Austropuccinia psidii MF-1]